MLELREIAALTACRELQKETSVHDSPCLSNRAAIHRAESCRKGTKEERNTQGGRGEFLTEAELRKTRSTSTQAVLLAGPVCPAGPTVHSLILP